MVTARDHINSNTVLLVLKKEDRKYTDEALSLLNVLNFENVTVHYVKKPNHRYYIQQDIVFRMRNGNRPKLIVIYDKLRPWQHYYLTKDLGVEIWDLIMLILKIFEIHAGTKEAKLQIELSRIKHQIPFVKEYIRMMKLGEQVGFMGPGVYGYESLLKTLKRKSVKISRELAKIKRRRELQVFSRSKKGFPHIAIIGYTCAGKTTLYNALTGDSKRIGPEPFKTLNPKSRLSNIACGDVIFTDTVGFIRKMPEEIIDVFHSVIAEMIYSDMLLIVVDISEDIDEILSKIDSVARIIDMFKINYIPSVIVFNKVDRLDEKDVDERIKIVVNYIKSLNKINVTDHVAVSALRKTNIDVLLKAICRNIDLTHTKILMRYS